MAMTPPSTKAQSLLLVCGSLVLAIAALTLARTILIPVVLATLLTFILSPVVVALQRRGLRRIPSVLLVVVLAFSILGAIGLAVLTEMKKLAAELPQHRQEIVDKVAHLHVVGKGSWLGAVYDMTDEITQALLQAGPREAAFSGTEPIPVKAVETSALPLITSVAGSTLNLLVSALLVIVLVVFMLIQREDLRNRLLRLMGKQNLVSMTKAVDDGAQRISRFLLVQFLINSAFGIAFGVGLAVIGVPYAVLWGFLAAALRYIPYIGSWIAAALPFALSVALQPGWTQGLCVLGLFLALEIVTWNLVEPWLFGQSIGVSAVALLIAAAFWGWLWGPIGLVMSTPLTACLVVLGRYVPGLEFFSILLGDEPVLESHVLYYQRLLARDADEAALLVQEFIATHPAEEAYDNVLLPALVLTKQNRAHGELTEDDEEFILQATRANAEELIVPKLPSMLGREVNGSANGKDETQDAKTLVYGCPARDRTDELALTCLGQLLNHGWCRFEVISSDRLSAEVIAQIEEDKPSLICIGALPAKGLAHTRYLCKRLRARFPDIKIFVGCWGLQTNLERTRTRVLAAGADRVGFTLLETRDVMIPLIQFQSHLQLTS